MAILHKFEGDFGVNVIATVDSNISAPTHAVLTDSGLLEVTVTSPFLDDLQVSNIQNYVTKLLTRSFALDLANFDSILRLTLAFPLPTAAPTLAFNVAAVNAAVAACLKAGVPMQGTVAAACNAEHAAVFATSLSGLKLVGSTSLGSLLTEEVAIELQSKAQQVIEGFRAVVAAEIAQYV